MASTAEFVQYVADNQLFLKPTQAAQKLLAAPVLRPPYPGASPSLLVEDTEDRALLCQLARATCSALPPPRPKRTQKPNKKRS